ncbi:protein kinase domain-containing protein [endosymbiont GvMRE of Glomus versiforme]|uniref:protein kinase domain-containing protein n=1 Tax=endosymbiont GvMRE of Glomus versiforme TaxID=2039283 RepID=UPI000EEFF80A|nr:protein kinase [endosymbiont GvMRE of Glomus versiforme]RHZ36414.1 Cdc15p [endosymbiont GvMRE of Glomus versiforme]
MLDKELREACKEFGLCSKCHQPNIGKDWCKSCTRGNPEVDQFIQKQQTLKWIPYKNFINTKHLADGGFSTVYKAKLNGEKVVLKKLNGSQNTTKDFLQEVACHKLLFKKGTEFIVECCGISEYPDTKEYIMVMKYISGGNLRQYLQDNYNKPNFEEKINFLLWSIASGLNTIHQQKLIHKDFHSGNIIMLDNFSYITDLGLCKPANEASKENKIFGVMPYVAPEILLEKPYTQASDIYSFGIIAYEVLSGLPPYYDREHDIHLAVEVCKGLRPQFQIKIPQLLEDLIKRCWDVDPAQRPTAQEIKRTLQKWEEEISKKESTEFTQQLQEAEEHNKTLPDEIKYPDTTKKKNPGAVYTSRLLPTGEISRLLQKFQSSEQYKVSKEFDINNLNLDELNFQEQEQTSQEAKIIQPTYGTPGSSKGGNH